MSTRLDVVLQKYPEHEGGVRLLASRDPSGNLRYLDWGAKIFASGQALAPEIADVIELFHQFRGQVAGPRGERVRSDLYTYRPQDLAGLRTVLFKMKRARDRKRRDRERLYHIEGVVEADIVYDSPDLVVRHIKNKNASVHFGHATKWCISMLREGYFEDYEVHNATFFFFERKAAAAKGDEFDKVALMVPRTCEDCDDGTHGVTAFTSVDRQVDMMVLAKVHGVRIFDIFREVYERSERYPGSAMFHVYQGRATPEQLAAAFASVVKCDLNPHETGALLESICCNDAAPPSLLQEIAQRVPALSAAAWKVRPQAVQGRRRRRRFRRRDIIRRRVTEAIKQMVRTVLAALVIHPAVPADVREGLVKQLLRRHVNIDMIRRVKDGNRVAVSYCKPDGGKAMHVHRNRRNTVKGLRARAGMFDRLAARARRKAKTLQRKLTEAKAKKQKQCRRTAAR